MTSHVRIQFLIHDSGVTTVLLIGVVKVIMECSFPLKESLKEERIQKRPQRS